jgi:hypothetical protein
MDIPEADWVGEGGVKPAAEGGVGVKVMTGKKVAVLVPVSEEVVRTNPAGVYDQLQQDLPTALARAFDYAAINGKSLRTGNAGPFAEYLALTPNSVALGTAAASAGGMYTDIVTASGRSSTATTTSPGSPRTSGCWWTRCCRPTRRAGRCSSGRTPPCRRGRASRPVPGLAGLPAYFNQGVSGKYWRQGDKTQTRRSTGRRPVARSPCRRAGTRPRRSPTTRRGGRADRDPRVRRDLRDRDRHRLGRWPVHDHVPGRDEQRAVRVGAVQR